MLDHPKSTCGQRHGTYIAPILRGALEVAPAMFGMVPHCANEMLAERKGRQLRDVHAMSL